MLQIYISRNPFLAHKLTATIFVYTRKVYPVDPDSQHALRRKPCTCLPSPQSLSRHRALPLARLSKVVTVTTSGPVAPAGATLPAPTEFAVHWRRGPSRGLSGLSNPRIPNPVSGYQPFRLGLTTWTTQWRREVSEQRHSWIYCSPTST